MSRHPRPDARLRLLRGWFIASWDRWGQLYDFALGDSECEAQAIRDECEERGLPMGYGRVQREPVQLNDYEARAQFHAGRHWK